MVSKNAVDLYQRQWEEIENELRLIPSGDLNI